MCNLVVQGKAEGLGTMSFLPFALHVLPINIAPKDTVVKANETTSMKIHLKGVLFRFLACTFFLGP